VLRFKQGREDVLSQIGYDFKTSSFLQENLPPRHRQAQQARESFFESAKNQATRDFRNNCLRYWRRFKNARV